MNADDKNLLADLIRHPAWQFVEAMAKENCAQLRVMATQAPSAEITGDMRTWFAARADMLETFIQEIKDKATFEEKE